MSTGYKPHCNRPHPSRGETIITTRRLDELEAKARAHDDYLEAIRTTRLLSQVPQDITRYGEGYRQAMVDLSQAIVDAAARRMQT